MGGEGNATVADLVAERFRVTVIPVIYSLVVVVGCVGNSLVLVVIACNRTLRDSTNVLIGNLAVSDLLFLIFCVPFTAAQAPTSNISNTLF